MLKGKSAIVTGSTSGIGLGIATALAAQGVNVMLNGFGNANEIKNTRMRLELEHGVKVLHSGADMGRPAEIHTMLSEAVHMFGGVDILVNNAGIQHTAPIAEMPREKWDAILQINLTAAFLTMKAALPAMAERGYGRVINIASVHGLVASRDKAPYVAAKFGLVGLSRVAALEYAARGDRAKGGVTVNCICPGWTETVLIEPQIQARAAAHGGDRDAGIAELLAEKQPSRRMSTPAEIGALALWLCSPVAHNLTGAAIPVDGGWTAQ